MLKPARLPTLVFCLLWIVACRGDEPLPVITTVPDFALTDHHGATLRGESLRGKVWAANFIFTSCPDICPVLTQKMALVRKKTISNGDQVTFVSFSVDPDTDTPQVLAEYAKKHDASHDGWYFVTGPLDDVKQVVVAGLKQVMKREDKPTAKGNYNVLHGSHFVLVDAAGNVRGYYVSDEPGLVKLAADAGRLLAGEGG